MKHFYCVAQNFYFGCVCNSIFHPKGTLRAFEKRVLGEYLDVRGWKLETVRVTCIIMRLMICTDLTLLMLIEMVCLSDSVTSALLRGNVA